MKIQDTQKSISATLQSKQAEAKQEAPPQKTDVSEESTTSSVSARVNLSEVSKGAQKAAEIVRETPDVRLEKVQALKEKIEAGEYEVDSRKVADKMLRDLLSDLVR